MKQFNLSAVVALVIVHCVCLNVMPQATLTGSQQFCDLHVHSSLKKFYQNTTYSNTLNWEQFDDNCRDVKNGSRSTFKNYIEADYRHMIPVNYDIICEALMPLEKNTVSTFSKRLLNKFGTGIGMRRLKIVGDDENSSFSELMKQYNFVASQEVSDPLSNAPMGGFKLIRDKNDLIQSRATGQKSVILTVEGGNALYGPINSCNVLTNGNLLPDGKWQQEMLDNVDRIKNLDHRVFYMSITHFGWTRTAGQGKAVDHEAPFKRWLASSLSRFGVTHKALHNKWTSGIVDEIRSRDCRSPGALIYDTKNIGKRVLDRLLDNSGRFNLPTYIDVRHMDVRSRLDYYKYLDRRFEDTGQRIPIIMSHAAVSGEDTTYALVTGNFPYFDQYSEVQNPARFHRKHQNEACFKNAQLNASTAGWFNPWSVNLAKEEISLIYESDGMIGLIFFDLTLGSTMMKYGRDHKRVIEGQFFNSAIAKESSLNKDDLKNYLEMESFLRNAFYIVENSGRSDASAWNHICIGSDFDSGMDPINICPVAASMPSFYQAFVRLLPVYADLNNQAHLLYGLNAEEIAKRLFHDNMVRFVLTYY